MCIFSSAYKCSIDITLHHCPTPFKSKLYFFGQCVHMKLKMVSFTMMQNDCSVVRVPGLIVLTPFIALISVSEHLYFGHISPKCKIFFTPHFYILSFTVVQFLRWFRIVFSSIGNSFLGTNHNAEDGVTLLSQKTVTQTTFHCSSLWIDHRTHLLKHHWCNLYTKCHSISIQSCIILELMMKSQPTQLL